MLDVGLFKNRRFTGASGAITLVFFALFGAMFFLTQYLQDVLGYSPLQAGVRMLPIAAGADRRRPAVRRSWPTGSAPSSSSPPA